MFKKKPKSKVLLIIFVVVLVLFGAFLLFKNQDNLAFLTPFSPKVMEKDLRTVENPLTGEKYTPEESVSWIKRRPIGVMINNHFDARPQSGLSRADLVYEILAEGGITRYLAFYQDTFPTKVGPIRSTREYYLVWVKEIGDSMLMHIGWSPQALEAIQTWPVRSLGRGGVDCGGEKTGDDDICWRDFSRDVAYEHTAFANSALLVQRGIELGWEGTSTNFQKWKFKDETPVAQTECLVGECKIIELAFSGFSDYTGFFSYDKTTNTYLRFTGTDDYDKPIPNIDPETGEQVRVKNLIVQFASESPIVGDDKSRVSYDLVGSGQAIVFIDGKAIQSTWSKASRDQRTLFFDEDGEEIKFNRGSVWIAVLKDSNIQALSY